MKQFVYRWERHAPSFDSEWFIESPSGSTATDYQRSLMTTLGEAGWEFVAFVNHWGPSDGKTMLFKRAVG